MFSSGASSMRSGRLQAMGASTEPIVSHRRTIGLPGRPTAWPPDCRTGGAVRSTRRARRCSGTRCPTAACSSRGPSGPRGFSQRSSRPWGRTATPSRTGPGRPLRIALRPAAAHGRRPGCRPADLGLVAGGDPGFDPRGDGPGVPAGGPARGRPDGDAEEESPVRRPPAPRVHVERRSHPWGVGGRCRAHRAARRRDPVRLGHPAAPLRPREGAPMTGTSCGASTPAERSPHGSSSRSTAALRAPPPGSAPVPLGSGS